MLHSVLLPFELHFLQLVLQGVEVVLLLSVQEVVLLLSVQEVVLLLSVVLLP